MINYKLVYHQTRNKNKKQIMSSFDKTTIKYFEYFGERKKKEREEKLKTEKNLYKQNVYIWLGIVESYLWKIEY